MGFAGSGVDHIYFLIDGYPIGYGPGGVQTPIKGDDEDIYYHRERCKEVIVTDEQFKCLKGLLPPELRGLDGTYPAGNWNPKKDGGCYNAVTHNCWDWAYQALDECHVNKLDAGIDPRTEIGLWLISILL